MIKRLSVWLYRVSTGWAAIVALGVLVVFMVVVLPAQSSQGRGQADVGSPDLSLYYEPSDLYRMAEAYGEEGRREYIQARFTFDLVWPMVYGAFLATALSWLLSRLVDFGSRWRLVNFVPALAMLLDYMENVSAALVMWRYPLRTPVVDTLVPLFTMAKWAVLAASFLLLLGGLEVLAVRRFRRRIAAGK
jgi:hypothetical protein